MKCYNCGKGTRPVYHDYLFKWHCPHCNEMTMGEITNYMYGVGSRWYRSTFKQESISECVRGLTREDDDDDDDDDYAQLID